ncbi:ATP-binding protein [Planctobacterium marinum]|uniref:Sensory/regulatory protein RpfC n=1 Tax=Planctobacterium marinum TaxID=1631968 RepID=A0AA48HTY9_9ALTE|nr:hypothetical protein MACH26_13240 [Planctobacterium marinum]
MQIRESEDFVAIRDSLIDRLVVAMLAMLTIALLGSFYRMSVIGFQPVMAVHIFISLVFLCVYVLRRRISGKLKAIVMISTLFLAGVAGLFNFGLVGAGTIILLVAGVMSALVLTSKIALAVLIAGAVVQVIYMLAIAQNKLTFEIAIADYALSIPAWLNNLTAYIVLSAICLYVIDKFFTYLKTMSAVLQHAVEEKHQELEHSELLLQTVLNSLPYGVFWKKPDLSYWGANKRFIQDIGAKHLNELLNKSDQDFKSEAAAQSYAEQDAEVLKSGEPVLGIITQSQSPEGEDLYTLTNKVPLIDKQNRIIGVLGAYEDVTEAKKMERALQEAVIATQQASQAKSEFLATMSHEIRTPINGVMGLLELTLDTALDERQGEYITKANLSAKTLLQIINQILDISKIEAGKMDLECIPFCISDVLQQLDTQLRHLALAKNLEFTIEEKGLVAEKVAGDPTKLLQVLVNLVSNAIKFTEQGGVTVTVGALKHQDKLKLQFVVADTGIGVAKEDQESLFQSFTQAESSTSRRFGGTGLGLSIVKQLLEMQGGSIEVKSEKGQGTRFICQINYDQAQHVAHTQKETKHKDLVGTKILLAEDNEINQLIACEMLGQAGAEVTVAGDGIQALQTLQKSQFDLVLMDIQMPNMDGTEALIKLRQNVCFHNLPVVALTANVLSHEVKFYREIGFSGHLGKPFQKEQLLSKIHEVLSDS